jgi:hypothetical protein
MDYFKGINKKMSQFNMLDLWDFFGGIAEDQVSYYAKLAFFTLYVHHLRQVIR